MIAVGIDISKAKSTVAVIDSDGTVLASPFTMAHTQPEMEAFVSYLKGLGEPTTILMEYTGHYHYPVLVIYKRGCYSLRFSFKMKVIG